MAVDPPLQALKKNYEADEHVAQQRLNEVQRVVAERRLVLESAKLARDELIQEIEAVAGAERLRALHAQDGERLAALDSYLQRLRRELAARTRSVAEHEKDLQLALDRAQLAEEDLVEARIQKRKVEKFLEDREQVKRIRNAALEEAATDELGTRKRSR